MANRCGGLPLAASGLGSRKNVKWLPAAEGEEGTLLGFGVHDRGALHGRYLVVRQWLDGASVEADR